MTDPTILPGSVRVACVSSTLEDDHIEIRAEDAISGSLAIIAKMSFAEFGLCLTGRSGKAEIRHFPNAPIGKVHEAKTEVIPIPKTRDNAQVRAALVRHERDGWIARIDTALNHNNWRDDINDDTRNVAVSFHRYVAAPKEPKP